MLQIIRGKLVIFLITLCLFVVYLGFDNNSNSDIVFYGHKTPKSVEIYLSETNMKIYEIARICGFEDANYFSRRFRNMYNLSPQQYRKQKHG